MLSLAIYRADGTSEMREVEKPEGYDAIRALVEPHLDGARMEHVTILLNGKRSDMFVDEFSRIHNLPRNEKATAIYRANWLSRYPETEPEEMPWIAGPAVVFSEMVWV